MIGDVCPNLACKEGDSTYDICITKTFRINATSGAGPKNRVCQDRLALDSAKLVHNDELTLAAHRIASAGLDTRDSAAATVAAAKSLAIDLRERSIAVGVFHPGWVQTDMTGHSGHLTAAKSARLLLARYDELMIETSGLFVHANGEVLPW